MKISLTKLLTYEKNISLIFLSISKTFPGFPDKQIIELANREEAVIITFDRDFGYLVFSERICCGKGDNLFEIK